MNPTYRQSRFGAFLYHQRLTAFKWLAHGFSLRSSPDGSLQNLAFNDGQSRELVQRNREKFMRGVWASAAPATLELGVAEPEETKVAAPRLVTLRQCHSDTVYALNAQPPEELAMEGDGLVTDQSGLLLSVLTADCMPILIAD